MGRGFIPPHIFLESLAVVCKIYRGDSLTEIGLVPICPLVVADMASEKSDFYEQVAGVNAVLPSSGSLLLFLFVALQVVLHRVFIRTLNELFLIEARCRLGFERRVDAAIYRTALETKTLTQSSEHGVSSQRINIMIS